MAAVTSGLAGGSVSAAKVDVVKTIDTSPSATIVCLRLMLRSPFLRLDYFTCFDLSRATRSCRTRDRAEHPPQHHVMACEPRSTQRCARSDRRWLCRTDARSKVCSRLDVILCVGHLRLVNGYLWEIAMSETGNGPGASGLPPGNGRSH